MAWAAQVSQRWRQGDGEHVYDDECCTGVAGGSNAADARRFRLEAWSPHDKPNPKLMKLNISLRSSRLRVEIVQVVVQFPEFRAAHESGLERRQSGGQAHMKRPELGQRRQKGDFRVGQFMIINIQPTKRRMTGQVVEIPVVAAATFWFSVQTQCLLYILLYIGLGYLIRVLAPAVVCGRERRLI